MSYSRGGDGEDNDRCRDTEIAVPTEGKENPSSREDSTKSPVSFMSQNEIGTPNICMVTQKQSRPIRTNMERWKCLAIVDLFIRHSPQAAFLFTSCDSITMPRQRASSLLARPLRLRSHPPRIRLPARPLRTSRSVPSVAFTCTVPSRITPVHFSSCRWLTFRGLGHKSQRPETRRVYKKHRVTLPPSKLLPFGLSLFKGILYASLYSNRPSNHKAMEGRSRRYSHGNHTRH
jgi:hypothetical protein